MSNPHVVILGGGPAGVGAAYKLHAESRGQATLIEQHEYVGGNAGSFEYEGLHLDFGSHRLHHATEPDLLADIQRLLGDDLKDRPRNGRIRLRGKWVKFPLNGKDLLLRLDKPFAVGAARDMALRSLPFGGDEGDTFASVLRAKLGPTICDHFYYPYSRKLWGHEPEELSAIQAHRRVSANSFGKLLMKVLKPQGKGFFYYPRKGFGQISQAYAEAAREGGATLRLGTRVEKLEMPTDGRRTWRVTVTKDGNEEVLEADQVWSTLPIPLVLRMMNPSPPEAVMNATSNISYRAMILAYLVLDTDQFTDTDAHYFPETNVRMSRLSEPKNYFGHTEPKGKTVLCAEIPCSTDEVLWTLSDEEIGRQVADEVRRVDLPLEGAPVTCFTRRLPQAYPIYLGGYEGPLQTQDDFASSLPNFVHYGRQGLFAHDNTHHALFMAYSAVDCIGPDGTFDRDKWSNYREVFKTHVVED